MVAFNIMALAVTDDDNDGDGDNGCGGDRGTSGKDLDGEAFPL